MSEETLECVCPKCNATMVQIPVSTEWEGGTIFYGEPEDLAQASFSKWEPDEFIWVNCQCPVKEEEE